MPEQTDTDIIYILSESAPTQIDNMVGLTDQLNLPAGYSRTRPDPTPTRGVYKVERTRRFNVEPLALTQADVLYDKTMASTVTLNEATGGELPLTYSLPLLRGSQDRFDVPGAPVTFDAATRELNIGSGFDEGIEVNYTARDACNQVANARVIVRPMGTITAPQFARHVGSSVDYDETGGVGHTQDEQLDLALGNSNPLPPYTIEVANNSWVNAGWSVEVISRDSIAPDRVNIRVTFGSWFHTISDPVNAALSRVMQMRLTDFLGNTGDVNFSISYT